MNKHTRLSLNSLSMLVFECINRSAAVPILVQISVFPFKGGHCPLDKGDVTPNGFRLAEPATYKTIQQKYVDEEKK